jgi:glycosyltransferase involved in cell wall biosynthesis
MEKRLRILVVTLEYPPPSIGGYEIMCTQVCQRLWQQGHDLLVLTSDLFAVQATEESDLPEGPILVRRILRCYWDGSECLYPSLLDALAIEQGNQKQFQETIAEYQPDVISFWHMGDMSLGLITTATRLGFPMLFVIGDDWLCYGWWADGWIRRFTQHPERAAAIEQQTGIPTRLTDLGFAGIFCFVSDYTRRRAENVGGWRFPRFDITFPGVSRTEFPPLTQIPEQYWKWRLLWIGRVIEEKGIMTAIDALRALPEETVLQIAGPVDPAYRHCLVEAATAIGAADRLSFSLVPRQEVRSYYQQADVTLFTSMIEHEAFGLVPLEAMASGCPVISTCVGGSAEYCVDGINCLRIFPGDPDALAHAIQKLGENPDLRWQLIEGGLQTASEMTLDRQAERIEQLLLAATMRYK